MLIHAGRRRDPQAGRHRTSVGLEHLAGRTVVADVGHARTDKHFLNLVTGDLGQRLDVVRVIRAGEQRLGDLVEIDLDDLGVLGIGIRLQELGVVEPFLHRLDATTQGALVLVPLADHPLEQGDVALEEFLDRLGAEVDGATVGRALGGGIGELERLLHFQVRQPLDLEHATIEDVLLALLLDGQLAALDRLVGDRVDEITQGDPRLHLALEAHQHRFRHIQRHHAQRRGEGHQAGAGREGDAQRETGMRVATGTDGIRQDHAVEPGVDHPITGAQRDAAAGGDEFRQLVLQRDVDRPRVRGGVTERLHDEIGGKAQAGQLLQLVAGHRAGGVLAADGGHLRLAVGARAYALDTAGAADHLLRESEALAGVFRLLGPQKHVGGLHLERLACLAGQAAANDQRDAATGTHLVGQRARAHVERGDHLAVLEDLAGERTDGEHVAGFHRIDVALDREGTRILGGIKEDRCDLAAQHHAAGALVGHVRNVATDVPLH